MADFLTYIADKEPSPDFPPSQVTIEGFGSIESARIKLAPLTILVGKNNTGKSYAAAMIWAMRSLPSIIGQMGEGERLRSPTWFREFILQANEEKNGLLEIEGRRVCIYLNRYLEKNKKAIAANLMSMQNIDIGKISLEISGKIFLSYLVKMPKAFIFSSRQSGTNSSWRLSWKEQRAKRPQMAVATFSGLSDDDQIADRMFLTVVGALIQNSISGSFGSATYIPAARTGLMLSLGYISSALIGSLSLSSDTTDRGRFSLPALRFLQRLMQDNPGNSANKIADFLEKNILCGELKRNDSKIPGYSYLPSNSSQSLPMHAVSSMVSELSPILAILRSSGVRSGLILEEPEAHLHLSAQRVMARAIAKLVNSGVPVTITTHSDTFLQQINLLIQIGGHKNKRQIMERLGYDKSEILDISRVECYEFISKDGKTHVRPSDKSSDGFVVSSLNDALIEMAEEVSELSQYDN